MHSKVHSGVILSISASSQTAKVRADDGNKHIVRLVDLVAYQPVDSVSCFIDPSFAANAFLDFC